MRIHDITEEAYGPEDYDKIKAKQEKEREERLNKSKRVKREREQLMRAQQKVQQQRSDVARASTS